MQIYEKEVWKEVPNYEGHYQVSNLGRVKSLERKHSKGGILSLHLNRRGYYYTTFYKDREKVHKTIHRLVMLAFVGESELTVNHKNGIKTDNRLENLEYCTVSENIQHAYDKGLIKRQKGELHGNSKLRRFEVEEIKYSHKGKTQKEIAKIYNISRQLVSDIRLGRRWNHI